MNEVEAAEFTALAAYLRPVGAIAAGLVADRASARSSILVLFAVLVASYLGTAAASGQVAATLIIIYWASPWLSEFIS